MRVDGACHCGHIQYQAEIDPARVVVCHCTDCQTMSGSAFRVIAFTFEDRFELLRGTIKIYRKTSADSGRPRELGFCPECGTGLYATAPGPGPKVYGLRVGTLRQRKDLKPTRQIWCRSTVPWLEHLTDLPGVPGQP